MQPGQEVVKPVCERKCWNTGWLWPDSTEGWRLCSTKAAGWEIGQHVEDSKGRDRNTLLGKWVAA